MHENRATINEMGGMCGTPPPLLTCARGLVTCRKATADSQHLNVIRLLDQRTIGRGSTDDSLRIADLCNELIARRTDTARNRTACMTQELD